MPQAPASSFPTTSGGKKTKKADHVETATLLVVISDKGYVCSARVLKSVNKELDAKAVEEVKKWTFRPAMKEGHPVPVAVTVQVDFRMNQVQPAVELGTSSVPPAPNP